MRRLGFLFLTSCMLISCTSNTLENRYNHNYLNTGHFNWGYTVSHGNDLWHSVREGFALPHFENHPRVQAQIHWYLNHPKTLRAHFLHAEPYLFYITQEVKRRRMPTEFALIPMLESGYNPVALSPVGACGLWQLMSRTASGLGIEQNFWYDGRRDIAASTQAALDYLTYLEKFFNGDWLLAIAAYDSGEGTVSRHLVRNYRRGLRTDVWSLPLPNETQVYLPKLLALSAIIKNPERYGVELPYIINAPAFEKVHIGHQIDLKEAARLAEIPQEYLFHFNSAYRHGITDPHGPKFLFIPQEAVSRFVRNLSTVNLNDLPNWTVHRVRRGESLRVLAEMYDTHPSLIQMANHLKGNAISVGKELLIPSGRSTKLAITGISTRLYQAKPQPAAKYTDESNLIHIKYNRSITRCLYTVENGDTIEGVARRFHTTIHELQSINALSGKRLKVGQQLFLSQKCVDRLPHKQKRHARNEKKNLVFAGKAKDYRLQKGDNLHVIAHSHGLSTQALVEFNHLETFHTVHPGVIIKIPLLALR